MLSKISIEDFSLEAKQQKDQFEAMERVFESDPSLTKITRNEDSQPYSYIWYQNPQTRLKTVIRLANKAVEGHVLGAGTYGRAKYGVDKEGQIYAVKIQQEHIELKFDPINQSKSPVEEATTTYDVQLAHGYPSTRQTPAMLVKFVQSPPNDQEMMESKIYFYRRDGMIYYKTKKAGGKIITQNTGIALPDHQTITPSLLSQIKQNARSEEHIPAKDSTVTSTQKSFQVLKLGESTLLDALKSTRTTIDLEEKISIARRMSWECSKLHTGKLSRTHQGYIHCDLKPANILLNRKKKSVLLIDYGLSVSADTTGALYGTPWYSPVINTGNSGTLSDPINRQSSQFDATYAHRTKNMGVGFDVFALKRVIYMPDFTMYGPGRCIFTPTEFKDLPKTFQQTIYIDNGSVDTVKAVNTIKGRSVMGNRKPETAQDLTLRLIALEAVDPSLKESVSLQENQYHTNLSSLENCTDEQKTLICECAELLDHILALDPTQTAYTRQDIINAIDVSSPLIIKNQLLMHASMLLLGLPYDESLARVSEKWFENHTEQLNALFLSITTTEDPHEREILKTTLEQLSQELIDLNSDDMSDSDDDESDTFAQPGRS